MTSLAINPAASNVQSSLNSAASVSGLLTPLSPESIIGNAVNGVLSISGIVLIVYLVYAGILYMQAGQEPKNALRAKQMILSAIIGLIIILAAYAVTTFVFSTLSKAISGA